jgi:hypothetical protein
VHLTTLGGSLSGQLSKRRGFGSQIYAQKMEIAGNKIDLGSSKFLVANERRLRFYLAVVLSAPRGNGNSVTVPSECPGANAGAFFNK